MSQGVRMFVRLVRFSIGAGQGPAARALADDLAPLIGSQPGCQDVTIFGDESDGEYGIFVLWDSQANADAAAGLVRPKLDEHLAGLIDRPPDARLFEVISD
jgi:heme-degrading monooxygenase HmoA